MSCRPLHKLACVSLLALVALPACRGGDDDDGGGGNGADASIADDTTIYQIQDGTLADGDAVTLRGVVVTAIDTYIANSTGSIWVAEPDDHPTHGRAYSGVQVFLRGTEAAGLQVGDLVDVEGGVVDEFALNCDQPEVDCTDPLQTLTEVSAPQGGALTVIKVGDGIVPSPLVVEPQALAADAAEAEKYEGVLVTFENVAVTSGPRPISGSETFERMNVTGPFELNTELTAFPANVARDDCFSSVTGILSWFFDYRLQPRSAADYGAAGDACLYETQAGDCDDGDDNDFDGFADCGDFSCQTANPDLCTSTATVVQVQDGTFTSGQLVDLQGVVVTAVSEERVGDEPRARGAHLFVQDAGSTADNSGIHIYRGTSAPALDSNIVIGSVVNLRGTVDEFETPFGNPTNYETQIEVDPATSDVEFVSNDGTPAVRSDVPLATLASDADGEPYEGMLVELTNLEVTVMDAGFGEFEVSDGTTSLRIDDELFRAPLPEVGTCYGIVRGVMGDNYGNRKVLIRSADDLDTTGGSCD